MSPKIDPKRAILQFLEDHDVASGRELREHLGITRQALNVHIRALIDAGQLVKTGSTRAARYMLPDRAPAARKLSRRYELPDLDEADVYDQIAVVLGLRGALRESVESILRYAFTEVLNNAIDHSMAPTCQVAFHLDSARAGFEVRDRGIGLFHSIASRLGLEDEHAAMIELLKGKTTTMPERHSGEGLFFTSRVADRFRIRSHRIQVEWIRARDDIFVSTERFIEGTLVTFSVDLDSRTRLEDVFAAHAPEEFDFQFQRTRAHVRLLQTEYVSRSEAKRLTLNLEKFREVVLDFRAVRAVGQGFADEIFRVFRRSHPDTQIIAEHANPSIEAMIRHVSGGDPE